MTVGKPIKWTDLQFALPEKVKNFKELKTTKYVIKLQ